MSNLREQIEKKSFMGYAPVKPETPLKKSYERCVKVSDVLALLDEQDKKQKEAHTQLLEELEDQKYEATDGSGLYFLDYTEVLTAIDNFMKAIE